MTAPRFWRRASFSVDETADIIGVSSDCLRGWLARLPFNDFSGLKQDGRIWLGGQDAFFFLLVSVLTQWGVPVREAFADARTITDDMHDGPEGNVFLAVTHKDGTRTIEPWVFEEYGSTPMLLIPLRELYLAHVDRCATFLGGSPWRRDVVRDIGAAAAGSAQRHGRLGQ